MFDKIYKVDPRSIWKHEANDFTPWLAENIAELGEAIGFELEVTDQEAGVTAQRKPLNKRVEGRAVASGVGRPDLS